MRPLAELCCQDVDMSTWFGLLLIEIGKTILLMEKNNHQSTLCSENASDPWKSNIPLAPSLCGKNYLFRASPISSTVKTVASTSMNLDTFNTDSGSGDTFTQYQDVPILGFYLHWSRAGGSINYWSIKDESSPSCLIQFSWNKSWIWGKCWGIKYWSSQVWFAKISWHGL